MKALIGRIIFSCSAYSLKMGIKWAASTVPDYAINWRFALRTWWWDYYQAALHTRNEAKIGVANTIASLFNFVRAPLDATDTKPQGKQL